MPARRSRSRKGESRGKRSPLRPLSVPIFYKRTDKEVAEDLHQRLVQAGVQAWLDTQNILPGQEWELEVRKAILSADSIILCLSSVGVNEPGYLQKEIRWAQEAASQQPRGRIFLLPLRLNECEVPESLKHLQVLDRFQKGWYPRLLSSLGKCAEEVGRVLPQSSKILDGEAICKSRRQRLVFGERLALATRAIERHHSAEADKVFQGLRPERQPPLRQDLLDPIFQSIYLDTFALAPEVALSASSKRRRLAEHGLKGALPDRRPELHRRRARGLYGEGRCLWALSEPSMANKKFQAVVSSYDESPDPVLRERAGHARNGKAILLCQAGRTDEAIREWDEVIERFGPDSAPGRDSLFNKDLALAKQGNLEAARQIWSDSIELRDNPNIRGAGLIGKESLIKSTHVLVRSLVAPRKLGIFPVLVGNSDILNADYKWIANAVPVHQQQFDSLEYRYSAA